MKTNRLHYWFKCSIMQSYYMQITIFCYYLFMHRNYIGGDLLRAICCFAGHSKLYDAEEIYEHLLYVIENLISVENIGEFWVGNYGDFDKLCAKAVREVKVKYPNIQLNLVIPYLTSEINEYKESYYKNYDNILVADMPEKTPKKARIIKCNQYMVINSQVLVCYVKYSWGGAVKTLEYAQKRSGIKIINLVNE